MHRRIRPLLWILPLSLAALAGCRASDPQPPAQPSAPPPLELPASAAPDPALTPLAFLAGRWVGVNPNKTVNEEHWTLPRGSTMLGAFRQVRRDGKCALIELSQIAVEDGQVILRLRHLHGELQVPAERSELSIFRLVSADGRRAEFAGTGEAEAVTSVVYELLDADTLTQTVGFDPQKSKEKPFTTSYRREGR